MNSRFLGKWTVFHTDTTAYKWGKCIPPFSVFLIDKVSNGDPWFIPLEGTYSPFQEPIKLKYVLKDSHSDYKYASKVPGKLVIPTKQYGQVEVRVYEKRVKGVTRRVITFSGEHSRPGMRKHGGVHGTD